MRPLAALVYLYMRLFCRFLGGERSEPFELWRGEGVDVVVLFCCGFVCRFLVACTGCAVAVCVRGWLVLRLGLETLSAVKLHSYEIRCFHAGAKSAKRSVFMGLFCCLQRGPVPML